MYPEAVRQLIETLKRLPGVGPKTAERYALHLCHYKIDDADHLLSHLHRARSSIVKCEVCFSVADSARCRVCSDTTRDQSIVLVVSGSPDIEAYERGGDYRGVYHALGGLLNPLEEIGPERLTVRQLLARTQSETVKEIILGFDPTVEGEITSQYLSKLLVDYPVSVSRIARGLPMGASVEYADDVTLTNALRDRKQM